MREDIVLLNFIQTFASEIQMIIKIQEGEELSIIINDNISNKKLWRLNSLKKNHLRRNKRVYPMNKRNKVKKCVNKRILITKKRESFRNYRYNMLYLNSKLLSLYSNYLNFIDETLSEKI